MNTHGCPRLAASCVPTQVILLIFSSGSWVFRWYLYAVAVLNLSLRLITTLCLHLSTCAPLVSNSVETLQTWAGSPWTAGTPLSGVITLVLLVYLALLSTYLQVRRMLSPHHPFNLPRAPLSTYLQVRRIVYTPLTSKI